jgi:hypothetical protein
LIEEIERTAFGALCLKKGGDQAAARNEFALQV